MPFFDWLEAGGTHPEWFKGKVGVTIGDALSANFGARHTHVFGPEVKLVCDPEDMLVGRLEEFLPVVSALLSGIGGTATWTYGSALSATYVGPKVDIRRAKSISKTSKTILARKPNPNPLDDNDIVDGSMIAAVTTMSVLLCGTAIALDLAIRFQYEDGVPKKGHEETIEKLKVSCYTITGRLMALLKILEEKGSWAGFAKQWLNEGKFLGLVATNVALGAFLGVGTGILWLLYAEFDLDEAMIDSAITLMIE